MPVNPKYVEFLKKIPRDVLERISAAERQLRDAERGLEALVTAGVITQRTSDELRKKLIASFDEDVRKTRAELEAIGYDAPADF